MKFNRVIMHFHPSRPDRLLGFNQSGELWDITTTANETRSVSSLTGVWWF